MSGRSYTDVPLFLDDPEDTGRRTDTSRFYTKEELDSLLDDPHPSKSSVRGSKGSASPSRSHNEDAPPKDVNIVMNNHGPKSQGSKRTNRDVIRSLSTEEMSELLGHRSLCDLIKLREPMWCDRQQYCEQCVSRWLDARAKRQK